MSNCNLICLAIIGMLLIGTVAAATSFLLVSPVSATTTPSRANETGTCNNMTGATFLFIQGAEFGSVSEINATASALELGNVSNKTILFSDRPDRIVTSIDTADFIGNWSTGPNSFTVGPA